LKSSRTQLTPLIDFSTKGTNENMAGLAPIAVNATGPNWRGEGKA